MTTPTRLLLDSFGLRRVRMFRSCMATTPGATRAHYAAARTFLARSIRAQRRAKAA